MKVVKKCVCCGKEFTTYNGKQMYCSPRCLSQMNQTTLKKVKSLSAFFNAAAPTMEIRDVEYLSFSKAAILMGCSRQYIYKLVNQGKLRASRLSNRMAIVRRSDIEKMLDASPYNRVLPGQRPHVACPKKKTGIKPVTQIKQTDEPLDYISTEDAMALYKLRRGWFYETAKINQIPVCKIAGRNYYSKSHIEDYLGLTADTSEITDWVTRETASGMLGINKTAFYLFLRRHNIPSKKEYNIVYYSKSHIAALAKPDLSADERYCTVNEVVEKYGLTLANANHIARVKKIEKVKVGNKVYLLKEDVERVMAERADKGLPCKPLSQTAGDPETPVDADWITRKEACEISGMSLMAMYHCISRYKIPVKKVDGVEYCQKSCITAILRPDIVNDDRFCTMEDVQRKYGLPYSKIKYIIKTKHVPKVKVACRIYLKKEDIGRVMAELAAKGW